MYNQIIITSIRNLKFNNVLFLNKTINTTFIINNRFFIYIFHTILIIKFINIIQNKDEFINQNIKRTTN